MIPTELIERIRETADIVGIIGEYVELKRQGTDFRGPCPFHQGTKRNFSVSPRKNMYYCFVCHESGDVFKFLMKRLGVDWPTSVKMVAEKSGIEVQETHSRHAEEKDSREPMWEVNGAAAEYFTRILWGDELGRAARAYLEQRGISRELADRVGLGFAPREIGLMRAHLNTLGFLDDRMTEAGLLIVPEGGGELRPRFRDRLIFPIYDVSSRVVGFGGRLLGAGEPKYLNSAESPVFSKGRLLYALNWARQAARRDERMLVVEGYFDAVRLIGAGIESVVAPMGTALTEEQAKLIRRYAERVYLLYDSDKAGLKATFRSGDELLKQGASVQVVTLPAGEDPDSYARTHGAAGIETLIGGSIDVFERKIQLLERGGWFGDLRKKRQALDRLLPTLRATSDPLTRDMYLGHAATAAGVSRDLLEREMLSPTPKRGVRTSGRVPVAAPAREESVPEGREPIDRVRTHERRRTLTARGDVAERELIRVLLHRPAYLEQVGEREGRETFRVKELRQIYDALVEHGVEQGPASLASHLPASAVELLEELLEDLGGLDHADAVMAGSMAWLHERKLTERMMEIDRERPLADDRQTDLLNEEKVRLQKELRRLGGRYWKNFRPRA